MRALFNRIDRTCATMMAVTFIGIHVPIASMVVYCLIVGFSGFLTVLLTLLVATMISTVCALYAVVAILAPSGAAEPTGAQTV